jgi:hypothetical protein
MTSARISTKASRSRRSQSATPARSATGSIGFSSDWWIIVTNAGSANPVCFIMKPGEVKQPAHRGEKEGRISYWLQPNQYEADEFREAWDRIGRGDAAS